MFKKIAEIHSLTMLRQEVKTTILYSYNRMQHSIKRHDETITEPLVEEWNDQYDSVGLMQSIIPNQSKCCDTAHRYKNTQ